MKILSFLIGAVLLYIIQDLLYKKCWNKKLNAAIDVSSHHAFEGDELTLTETITNEKLLPLPSVKVKFMTTSAFQFDSAENSAITDNYYRSDLLSVMFYQRITRRLPFICRRRGFYSISDLTIVCTDMFYGSELIKPFPCEHDIYVYPKQIDTDDLLPVFRKMFGPVLTKRFINEDPFEFRSIREYHDFDSLHAVNWKASAKTGELKVNTHEYTSTQQFHIFLNIESSTLRKQEELMEESIRLAASLATASVDRGIPVCLSSNCLERGNPFPLTLPAGSGSGHLKSINELLARVNCSLDVANFSSICDDELKKASETDFVILISSYQRHDLQEIMLQLKQSGSDFLWIVPVNREVPFELPSDFIDSSYQWTNCLGPADHIFTERLGKEGVSNEL